MHYRTAGPNDDLLQIREFCLEALKESPHKDVVDIDRVTNYCWSCMKDGELRVLFLMLDEDKLVGVLFGAATENVLYPSVGGEVFWYVKPEYRGKSALKLFDMFDDWSKSFAYSACSYFPSGQDLSKLYERYGYKPVEISYVRKNNENDI